MTNPTDLPLAGEPIEVPDYLAGVKRMASGEVLSGVLMAVDRATIRKGIEYLEAKLKARDEIIARREAAIEAREARIIALQSQVDLLEGFKQGALEGAELSRQRIAALEAENFMLQSKIMQSDETIRVLEVALNTIANVVQHPDVVAEEALARLAELRGKK